MFNMDLTDDKNSYIQSLEKENHYLKYLLDQAGISYHMTKIADSGETLPDSISNSRILPREITEKDAQRFFSMFWGRTDVYNKRSVKKFTRAASYYSQCCNFWKDGCYRKQGSKNDARTVRLVHIKN